ncbi:MAG: ribose-phosphate pyrophosphokinase [bacterium]|nr:ribose-phosphate pyrophosphokinase [bacterium]
MIVDGKSVIIVGTQSDDPFAIDIGAFCQQPEDIADLLSLKTFANSEFCPRFISDEKDLSDIGWKLRGSTVVVVSTANNTLSRNELTWRTMLVTRAAKDNGADRVVLVEPDLFFSAQDRGPRPEHGNPEFERTITDYKKFDGQPFTSLFYAQALALAGVDAVITVHNHSTTVQKLCRDLMIGGLLNLNPAEVFADYIRTSDVTPSLHNGQGLLVCAPDFGARKFATEVYAQLAMPSVGLLYIAKERKGERDVSSLIDADSPSPVEAIAGKDVIVFDDMVRTGNTIRECCRLLKEAGAGRVVFFVSHFYSSPEVRENLNSPVLDEIVTTNTLPCILNRDMQGRLRRKMTVLKLEKWISRHILEFLGLPADHLGARLYSVDMSSKNPRAAALAERLVHLDTGTH